MLIALLCQPPPQLDNTITIALLAGAVVGGLYPRENQEPPAGPVGDRVFCGLLALPLIAVLAHLAFQGAQIGWKLVAPAPLAIYTLLLAATDWKLSFWKEHFTLSLVIGIGVLYAVEALIALSSGHPPQAVHHP